MTYFKPSIVDFGSVSDCKMIVDELKIDLSVLELNIEQQELLFSILEKKKEEIDIRYGRYL